MKNSLCLMHLFESLDVNNVGLSFEDDFFLGDIGEPRQEFDNRRLRNIIRRISVLERDPEFETIVPEDQASVPLSS
jgi:hypothetical protein